MAGNRESLTGLEFHYDNEKVRFFGRRGGVELSFVIDGSHGECVSKVVVGYRSIPYEVLSLQVGFRFVLNFLFFIPATNDISLFVFS